jgi:hypothetical protein
MARSFLLHAVAALTFVLPMLGGCTGLEKCPESPCDGVGCLDLPCYSRNRVYVFLISGLHPFCHLGHLRHHLIDHGFIKIYNGHRPHGEYFAKEIQKIKQCEEHARFVIVSQGSAAGVARDAARLAGTPIDVMVFLDETGIGPAHAERVIFIHGEKIGPRDDKVAQQSFCLADGGHLGVAKHPQTTKLIVQELCAVAAKVPIIEHGPRCELADCPPCAAGCEYLRPDGRDASCPGCMPLGIAAGAAPATMLPPPLDQQGGGGRDIRPPVERLPKPVD